MIAQHRNRSVAKIAYKTQYLQRIWTAIYEVTREPETVLFFSEPDFVEEASQFRVTTLDVTDPLGRRTRRHAFGKVGPDL